MITGLYILGGTMVCVSFGAFAFASPGIQEIVGGLIMLNGIVLISTGLIIKKLSEIKLSLQSKVE